MLKPCNSMLAASHSRIPGVSGTRALARQRRAVGSAAVGADGSRGQRRRSQHSPGLGLGAARPSGAPPRAMQESPAPSLAGVELAEPQAVTSVYQNERFFGIVWWVAPQVKRRPRKVAGRSSRTKAVCVE